MREKFGLIEEVEGKVEKFFEEVLDIKNGKNQTKVENSNGKYPIYGSGGVMGYADDYICEGNTVIIGRKGNINTPIFVNTPFWNVDTAFGLMAHKEVLLPKYLYYFCKFYDFERLNTTVTIPSLTKANLQKVKIKLPNLLAQGKVVKILERIEDLIESRRQELEQLDILIKARFIEMFGEPRSNPNNYVKKQLRDTCTIITGNTPSRVIKAYYGDYIEWIKTDNIVSEKINPTIASESLSEEGLKVGRIVEKDAILMACIAGSIASIGRVCITDRRVSFNQQINAIVPQEYDVMFLYVLLQISKEYLVEDVNMALKGILSKSRLENKEFILPPMDLQKKFVLFVQQIDKLKVEVQKSLDELQILFDSLMQKYFG